MEPAWQNGKQMDRTSLQRISIQGKKRVAWALVILGMVLIWPREQWLPDGKHISFVYRGTIYVVLAEAGKA